MRHYPAPGAFVCCANKGVTAERPKNDADMKPGQGYGVWSAIAISFAKDPTKYSSMYVEDAGVWETPNEDELIEYLKGRRNAMAKSIASLWRKHCRRKWWCRIHKLMDWICTCNDEARTSW